MMFGWIFAVLAGGVAGWWFGSSRARTGTTRRWMRALEEAKTENIIDEDQRSQIIRMEGSLENSNQLG